MKQRDPHALIAKQRKAGAHKMKKQPVPIEPDDPLEEITLIRLNNLRLYLKAKQWSGKPLTKEELKCLDLFNHTDYYRHFAEEDIKLIKDASVLLKDSKMLKKKIQELFD